MNEEKKTKLERCKYAHHHLKGGYSCMQAGWNKAVTTDEAKCEACDLFKSKFIEFPLTIDKIDVEPINTDS